VVGYVEAQVVAGGRCASIYARYASISVLLPSLRNIQIGNLVEYAATAEESQAQNRTRVSSHSHLLDLPRTFAAAEFKLKVFIQLAAILVILEWVTYCFQYKLPPDWSYQKTQTNPQTKTQTNLHVARAVTLSSKSNT